MSTPRQLTFDLPVVESRDRGDFFVAPSNAIAFDSLEAWRSWPNAVFLLIGGPGTGKSHLARIWQENAGALALSPSALADADIAGLAHRPVLLDDADRLAGDASAEEALFHLLNAMRAEAQPLLLTAAAPPRDWQLGLPDLASRLAAIPSARIEPPDEALLAAVLVKLFADRQIAVAPNVIGYLTPRMERSLAFAARLVRALDQAALREGRAVSRTLAARVLETLDNPPETGA